MFYFCLLFMEAKKNDFAPVGRRAGRFLRCKILYSFSAFMYNSSVHLTRFMSGRRVFRVSLVFINVGPGENSTINHRSSLICPYLRIAPTRNFSGKCNC